VTHAAELQGTERQRTNGGHVAHIWKVSNQSIN